MYNKAKHRAWLTFVHRQYLGIDPLEPIAPTGCFACTAPLPAVDDQLCSACRRISCGVCGACCCGRLEYEEGLKAGSVEPWTTNSFGRGVRNLKNLEGLQKIRAVAMLAKSKRSGKDGD